MARFSLRHKLPFKLHVPIAVKKSLRSTRRVVAVGAAVLVVMIVPLVIWQLHSPFSKVQAAWFDSRWGFRQRIPLSNSSGTNMTSFQVELTGSSAINTATLISAGKMQSSCQDMRFTDNNGKLLPFWIEPGTCNTSATVVWINVPSIPSQTSGGTADIYFYYGNSIASAANYTTSQVFIRDMTSAAAAWPLDDTTTTQSYARVQNPATSIGRNLVINGTFDTNTIWSESDGTVTIAGGVGSFSGTGSAKGLFQTLPMVIGRTYQITITVSGYSSGGIQTLVGSTAAGVTYSANGTYTQTALCAGDTIFRIYSNNASTTLNVDNVTVAELNIPASGATPTQLLVDGTMEASGVAAWTVGNSAVLSKQSTNPHSGSQLLRVSNTSGSNGYALQTVLTVGTAYRMYGYARSDGTGTPRAGDVSSTAFSGTTSTTWQPFDYSFTAISTAFVLRCIGSTSTYCEFDDVTLALDTGIRSDSILSTLDGNMELSGTSYWSQRQSATLSKDASAPHSGTQALKITSTGVSNPGAAEPNAYVVGKTYHVTGWMKGDGTVSPRIRTSAVVLVTGTSSTSWQAFDVTAIVTSTDGIYFDSSGTTTGTFVEIDDVVAQELDPMVGLPTNGVTLGATAGGHLTNAYSFDGTNDNVNIYSGSLNSAFNPNEGTLIAWAKVSGSGVWSDGVRRYIATLQIDSNDHIDLRKEPGSNQLVAVYTGGGTSKSCGNVAFSSTSWFQVGITWSQSSGNVICYINGAQSGSTQSPTPTLSGNLASTTTVIGAATTAGVTPWSGLINDVHLYNYALSSAQISDLYGNGTVDRQAYYTENDPGHELIRQYNTNVTIGAFASEETGAGALLHWEFDEGTGTTAYDSSSNNNSGTLGGSTPPTWLTEDNCVLNKCLGFDGQSSVVTGSKVANNVESIGFWIYPTSVTSRGIMNLDGGTHTISINSSGQVTATGWSSPTYYVNGVVSATPILQVNQWQYVEVTTATPFNTTSSFTVGTDGSTFFAGNLDEVKFYNYTRSAAQVQVNYNNYAGMLGAARQSGPTGLVADWPFQDTTSTQSYASVVNPGQSTGRNILLNTDFSSGWTFNTGWTTSGGVLHGSAVATSVQAVTSTNSGAAVQGRAYQVTYTVSNYSAGGVQVQFGSGSLTTIRSANGTYTENIVVKPGNTAFAFQAATSAFTGDISNVSVVEVNIPSSSITPVQLLVDGNMEASGTSAWTVGNSATLSKQTTNPHSGTQLLRVTRNGGNTPYASQSILTVGQVYRVTGYTRSDGSASPIVYIASGTSGFTGTTSTTWQPFDFVYVATTTNILFGSNTSTGTQYVEFDDLTVSLDTGIRSDSILSTLDGNMEVSGTSYWTATNGATLSKQTASPHSGSQLLRVAGTSASFPLARQQNIFVIGKTYRVTGYARSDGTYVPRFQTNSNTSLFIGTTSTSWQPFDVTFTALNTDIQLMDNSSTTTGYTEWDDLTVNEVSPLVGVNTNGVTVGATSGGHLANAYSFDGTNDVVNIYSGTLNSVFNPNEGSISLWAKTTNWAPSGTATLMSILSTTAASGNNIWITMLNNKVTASYAAGSTNSISTITQSTTGWFHIVYTWSQQNNKLALYMNDALVGTAAMPGVWVGNLNNIYCNIGALINNGADPFPGSINDVRLYNRALTPGDVQQLYGAAPGPVGYWKMDERKSTSIFDSSGNGNTGTLTGSPVPSWTVGKYGSALSFDGSQNYVTLAANRADTDFTMSAWVNTNSTAAYESIFSLNEGWLQITSSGTIYYGSYDSRNGTGSYHTNTTSSISTNTWYYLTLSGSGSALNLYVNGSLVSTTVSTGSAGGTYTTPMIGGGGSLALLRPFNGVIDDAKVYNYLRTPSQISDDMRGDGSLQPVNSLAGSGVTNNDQPATPLGYWEFDEGRGTTANNSGSAGSTANGTLTNMASPATATSGWTPNGKINKALEFDNTNDYVAMPSDISPFKITSDLTLDAWINLTATSDTNDIITKWTGTASTSSYDLYVDSSGKLNMKITDGTTITTTTSTRVLSTGTWYHVVGTYLAGNAVTLFINGVQDKQTATAIPAALNNSTTIVDIGAENAGTNPFNGMIDEPKIYNFALTPGQIQNDLNAGTSLNFGTTAAPEASLSSGGAGNAPIAYWNFDEGTGTTANDTSGNGNSGTLSGGAGWTNGKIGKAVSLAGSQYVDVADNNLWSVNTTNALTVNSWFKVSNLTTRQEIVAKGDTNQFEWDVRTETTGAITGNVFTAAGASICNTTSASSAIALNTWYYESFVIDITNSKCLLYLNGALQQSSTLSGAYTNGIAHLEIGSRGTGAASQTLTGAIDDVKVYNYARTQAQVAYDYNRGGPVTWWQFDECQGTTANDNSGFGNTGTIHIGGSGSQTLAGTCNTSGTAWGNGATGKYNASLSFDGNDDYVSSATAATTNIDNWALSAWVNPQTLGTGFGMIAYNGDDAAGYGFGIGGTNGGVGSNLIGLMGSVTWINTSYTFPSTNKWYHIVMTRVSGTTSFYVNGALISTTSSSTPGTPDARFSVSAEYSGASPQYEINALIDDVRAYDYGLSATQVQKLYNDNFGVFYGPSTGSP